MEGIWNNTFKTEDVERIAAQRMEICEACPDIDKEGSKCLVPGTAPCCGKCGCKLSYKTRSLSSACGNEEAPRWPAILTDEEQDQLDNHIENDNTGKI